MSHFFYDMYVPLFSAVRAKNTVTQFPITVVRRFVLKTPRGVDSSCVAQAELFVIQPNLESNKEWP